MISDSGSEDTATPKSVKKDTPQKTPANTATSKSAKKVATPKCVKKATPKMTPVFKLATPNIAKKAATPKKACDNTTEFQCKTSSLCVPKYWLCDGTVSTYFPFCIYYLDAKLSKFGLVFIRPDLSAFLKWLIGAFRSSMYLQNFSFLE